MKDFDYKKSLGQNFIHDENIINKIVNVANIDKDTLTIEIGPGSGALSSSIVSMSGYSLLYEIDQRLEPILRNKLDCYDNYDLIINDILKVSLINDISNYNYKKIVVVANIPYYITTPIISKLINEVNPDRIVIMIQEEVADRITALPRNRNYGFMSIIVQSKYKATKEFRVPKEYFTPIPKVDSAVIKLEKINNDILDYNYFYKLVGDAFRYKRKNIKNNLVGYDLNIVGDILKKYNLSITDRSEEVPVSCFIELANKLKEHE